MFLGHISQPECLLTPVPTVGRAGEHEDAGGLTAKLGLTARLGVLTALQTLDDVWELELEMFGLWEAEEAWGQRRPGKQRKGGRGEGKRGAEAEDMVVEGKRRRDQLTINLPTHVVNAHGPRTWRPVKIDYAAPAYAAPAADTAPLVHMGTTGPRGTRAMSSTQKAGGEELGGIGEDEDITRMLHDPGTYIGRAIHVTRDPELSRPRELMGDARCLGRWKRCYPVQILPS
ncbi:hypothetical protein B0H11DRAFT_1932123 [Mycena galericulata]|nr:hypothetical protein B0H11DRAFT_1932123 [Mycena galericulata]